MKYVKLAEYYHHITRSTLQISPRRLQIWISFGNLLEFEESQPFISLGWSVRRVVFATMQPSHHKSKSGHHKSGSGDHKSKDKTPSNVTMWNKDGSDFICLPQFHNSLPNAPSGPYLKSIELSHRYQDFSQYKTSSLERNYIWQPHFGPDLGLRLDLVDQEAILNPVHVRNEDSIDASEMRLLKGDAPERGRGKLRSIDGGEKPWWLRNTTYLENNLYSSVVQTKTDFKRQRVGAAFVSGIAAFAASFDSVDANVQRLAKESKEKFNLDIEWSVPVLPGGDFSNSFALARFDEDPDTSMNRPKADAAIEDASKAENEAVYGILTNIQQSSVDEENIKTSTTSFYASLVLPSGEKNIPEEPSSTNTVDAISPSGEEDDNAAARSGGSESSSLKGSSITASSVDTVLYKWMRNFTMDVNTKQDDSFILTIDAPDNSSSSASASSSQCIGSVSYHPIRSRLELKKLNDCDEHLAVVARRELIE